MTNHHGTICISKDQIKKIKKISVSSNDCHEYGVLAELSKEFSESVKFNSLDTRKMVEFLTDNNINFTVTHSKLT